NGRIYTEEEIIAHGYIIIKDDKITGIGKGDYEGTLTMYDVKGRHILPGFIDIHMHGGYGEDAMDASFEGLKHLAESLLSEGTTSFLATTMTQSDDNITKALENIVSYQKQQEMNNAADIVGVHLEGPFISEYKVGAQNPDYVQLPSIDKVQQYQKRPIITEYKVIAQNQDNVQRPTIEKLQQFQKTANNQIKVITYAPEVEGAHETLEALYDQIRFSIGHTVATFDETNEAVARGAK